MTSSHIVAGARTPIGKMSGAFSTMSAAQLGSVAIAGALERAGVDPAEVDHVVMGQVLMAGQGQVPAPSGGGRRNPHGCAIGQREQGVPLWT